jgi:2-polyprenyl-3-methyl-5-hydroxy-6-metoxy-1,4-benzoquinol methylase
LPEKYSVHEIFFSGIAIMIDSPWPSANLESVNACPFCQGIERDLLFDQVQDWTFYSAPGKWSYWKCKACDALYLNPRPTIGSIGDAYSAYYTHGSESLPLLTRFKILLKNEYFSHLLGLDLHPRIELPYFLSWILYPLKRRLGIPFGVSTLRELPRGRLVDVGCGSGEMLQIADQFGWDCLGLELDTQAVLASKKNGLTVIEGSFENLDDYPSHFDCIICSHVLEHVHDPIAALEKMKCALKPGGVLLLSCPNSMSRAGQYFGVHWRGLEAPRHIAIPSAHFLREFLEKYGFQVEQHITTGFPTIRRSLEIRKKALYADAHSGDGFLKIKGRLGSPSSDDVDFMELICTKK